jgi:NADPH:quinone reductase-like Zn-dependent oxidoreductase
MALSPFVHQRLTSLLSRQRQADLEHLAQLIEVGQLTPVIGNTYPLRQASGAMRDLRDGCACGKLIITVAHTG